MIYTAKLQTNHYGAILADPPWHFKVWSLNKTGNHRHPSKHYQTMPLEDICALPVGELAAENCALFMWVTWPFLERGMEVINRWGFKYKTCAFDWMKISTAGNPMIGGGYWTRSNTEPCLLATCGKPKRVDRGVPMAVLEPRREHSRKPQCIRERVERLVGGPYLELFARERRDGWSSWGNETEKFKSGTND